MRWCRGDTYVETGVPSKIYLQRANMNDLKKKVFMDILINIGINLKYVQL